MKKYLFYISHLYAFSIVRPIQIAIEERGDEVAWFLAGPYESYLRENERLLRTAKEVKDYNPCAVFVASNVVPDFFPGIKVQLFHGFNAQKRDENKGHFRIRGFFDLYCTQGPTTTGPFEELEKDHGFFEVKETGWPKMDPLFETIETKKHDRPVVLFTSTFTPALSAAHAIFDSIKALSEKGDWQWIVTVHPKMDRDVVARYQSIQGENLTFVETDDTIPLLKTADVMLSDTSSIISEFLLQQKPVVTFRTRVPGPHLINISDPREIEGAIEGALTRPEALMTAIKAYTDSIHPYSDGMSSVRVLEATDSLVVRGLRHLKRKPLNIWRRLEIRKKLGCYHWV